jgi:DNA-binding response OmpR family regulator
MLTTFYDRDRHSRALEEGASGFLLKTCEVQELVEHIRAPDDFALGRPHRRRTRVQVQTAAGNPPLCASRPSKSKWWRRLLLKGVIR